MLSVFQKLITISESEEFKSKYLKNLTKDFYEKDNTARLLLKNFNNSLKAFDSRLNILVAITFNMAAMWDIQNMLRLENLKQKLNNHLPVWFNIIAEIDALNSFANFNFNNPEYVFPTIEKENFKLKIKSGGHPLIDKQNRIDNDFEISGLGKITIITGANMAGKSTFLRTVGVNMLLASTGAKVCAKEFIFKPTDIYTSVRTNDSLSKNESYFYSELMRLKKIIDKLKSDEELFVIIDEMLRGTNSNDKHKGSQGLIEQLIKYKVTGLVATHDVLLGNMKNDYPKNIDTKKFEVDIVENDISFDYKLKDGVSQNLNATFLMKKYGIIE
jgi:DNA mismatch repair ATPase MutS